MSDKEKDTNVIPDEFHVGVNVKLTAELIMDLKSNTKPLSECSPRIQDAMCALVTQDRRCLVDDGNEVYRASADLEDILMGKM